MQLIAFDDVPTHAHDLACCALKSIRVYRPRCIGNDKCVKVLTQRIPGRESDAIVGGETAHEDL